MDYLLIYLLILFVVGIVAKAFLPDEAGHSQQSNTLKSSSFAASRRRPLHPSEDCLDPNTERLLLDTDGAIDRLRLSDVQRAPTGELLEHALYPILDGHIINPESRSLYRYGIYISPVRGSSYRSEQDILNADTAPGKPALLEREPENEYDPNAIIIRDALTRRNLGYVNKLNAKRIAKLIDANSKSLQAIFIRGDGPGSNKSPMRILITSPERLGKLLR